MFEYICSRCWNSMVKIQKEKISKCYVDYSTNKKHSYKLIKIYKCEKKQKI